MRKTIVALLLVVVAVPVLAAPRSVGEMYDGLSALSCGERRVAYAGYSREQQLELWTLHLQKFLASHPNLTGAQRAVVDEGLKMIASGALNRIDPAAMSLVQSFKQRAQQQFDEGTFKDAFVRLGGRGKAAAGARRPELVQSQLIPFCECDWDEDCFGTLECNLTRPCQEVVNCGPFGMDWCFGMCE